MLYSSIENKKIKELKKLHTKKYRDETGLFLVEGTHLIEEAYNKGYLKELLLEEGFEIVPVDYRGEDIDFVLLGFDTELNYEKVRGGSYYVSRGYPYIGTNCDLKCPVLDNKFIPDCGAIAKMIELATDRMPQFLGKPERTMVDAVSKEWNMPVEKIACVGDRLYTDIAVGINAGATSICVLTGEATKEEIEHTEFKPDYCFDSIKELYQALL